MQQENGGIDSDAAIAGLPNLSACPWPVRTPEEVAMNENIVSFINNEAMPKSFSIIRRRLGNNTLSEEKQRIKIIEELLELFRACYTNGFNQSSSVISDFIDKGNVGEACEVYRMIHQSTRSAELADVAISTMTLKSIRGEAAWHHNRDAKKSPIPFLKMIEKISSGCDPDFILDWVVRFANAYSVNLQTEVMIKLIYNDNRPDWEKC